MVQLAAAAGRSRRIIGDYGVGRQIGSSSFSVVWEGRHLVDGTVVAIKEVYMARLRTMENSIKALLMNFVHQTLASFFHYGVHSLSYGNYTEDWEWVGSYLKGRLSQLKEKHERLSSFSPDLLSLQPSSGPDFSFNFICPSFGQRRATTSCFSSRSRDSWFDSMVVHVVVAQTVKPSDSWVTKFGKIIWWPFSWSTSISSKNLHWSKSYMGEEWKHFSDCSFAAMIWHPSIKLSEMKLVHAPDFSERAVEKVTEKNRCVTKLRPATKKLAKYEKALGASTATTVKLVAKKDELAPTLNIEQARLRKTQEKEDNWNRAKVFTEQEVMNFTSQRFLSPSICEYPILEEDSSPMKNRTESKPIIGVKRSLSSFQKAQDQEK
ncbi:hypothetical protein F2Q69_00040551 [Brassica cretica]|uniref:Uncharacterized protein n=1 Tax=Brassica cretica TaxID=69181 RepID=A0A8S9N6N4_BRACR|nr:hypothetical protein F2Q69_00040551 [Brassica cretica]